MARKADVKGGNGDVVFDAETGTARKYLRNTSTAEKVTRFKRELAVFQELCKNPIPNVVEVTDVYIDEDKIAESYVEMKKYDGSVYDILEVTKGNVKLVFELLLPVIKALYTLSTGNPPLYHRDIKPDNILFLKKDDEYTLYLTDFGTCFLNDGSERLTPETMAVGPRMYIAPEYETGRVEEVIAGGNMTPEEEAQYRVRVYQEKRNLELLEIKEKNRLIVNSFSQYYIKALEELLNTYPDFELIQKLYDEYRKNSKDGIDYTSVNVENNASHYLYSGTYDRIYFSINYEPARGTDRYCSITIKYTIDSWKTIRFYYSEDGTMLSDHNGVVKLMCVETLYNILNSIIMEYIA